MFNVCSMEKDIFSIPQPETKPRQRWIMRCSLANKKFIEFKISFKAALASLCSINVVAQSKADFRTRRKKFELLMKRKKLSCILCIAKFSV